MRVKMLTVPELAELSDQFLEEHRNTLIIDPFFTIKIEIQEGEFTSECIVDDKSADSWIVRLNPKKHSDVFDIQYSVVEALLEITFERYDRKSTLARLTTAVCTIFEEEAEEEYDEA
jgi:hypothetical protein